MTDRRSARIAKMSAEDPTLDSRFAKAEQVSSRLLKPVEREQKKEKVVRLTVSMPESDHVILNELRVLMTRADGTQLNASQVVRAALRKMRGLSDSEIRKAAATIE